MSPRRLRAALVALLSLLLVAVTIPAAAQAAKVRAPGAWKASNTYLVRVDLDGRKQPKLKPVAKVNHVKAGQWVRISCQVRGQSAYGSTLWAKVGGLYVPDHYLKTYTDGFIPGVPRCRTTKRASGPSLATLRSVARQVAMEQVRGSLYRQYKERYGSAKASGRKLNWGKDGCSIPSLPGWTKLLAPGLGVGSDGVRAGLRRFFEASCDRHDFGYRNYGPKRGGLQVQPTRAGKDAIDTRFRSNMFRQCDKEMIIGLRGRCKAVAEVIYQAVHRKGDSAFFKK